MKKLINDIKKYEHIKEKVDSRLEEFSKIRESDSKKIFLELCFCFMTANFQAGKSMLIQNEIGEGFIEMSEEEIRDLLKKFGHRFWPQRSKMIYEARWLAPIIKEKIESFKKSHEAREWIVKNVYGIGMKEASHFMRNIGYFDLAIIDKHIINLLDRYSITEKTKGLGKKKYLEYEATLLKIANKMGMSIGELDLYLWYMETGKILK